MRADFRAWAARVRRFDSALRDLQPCAKSVGVEPPIGQSWFELLQRKLLPQLDVEPFLVVGIVGGTNIGKSLLFNHLAGEVASAVSPLAAGTKHPVCLVPAGTDGPAQLAKIFDGFTLVPWQSADDPLREDSENLLFWRVGKNVPPRLLLLDAPDVDSDAVVNWQRARAIRQAADVLLAVLTQQKYNDAAVKQFFREAVQADKPIVVLFNQCDLEADRDFWPLWLKTFSSETGAEPELVYVIPLDRQAAGEMRLPFYQVVGRHGPSRGASSLRDELGAMHFDAIKIRTFRGALNRVLDPAQGAGMACRRACRWRAVRGSAPRALRGRDGPGGLAFAPGRRVGRRNPPVVGLRTEPMVAECPWFLPHRRSGCDLADPQGVPPSRPTRRSAGSVSQTRTGGDPIGRAKDARRAKAAGPGGQ